MNSFQTSNFKHIVLGLSSFKYFSLVPPFWPLGLSPKERQDKKNIREINNRYVILRLTVMIGFELWQRISRCAIFYCFIALECPKSTIFVCQTYCMFSIYPKSEKPQSHIGASRSLSWLRFFFFLFLLFSKIWSVLYHDHDKKVQVMIIMSNAHLGACELVDIQKLFVLLLAVRPRKVDSSYEITCSSDTTYRPLESRNLILMAESCYLRSVFIKLLTTAMIW